MTQQETKDEIVSVDTHPAKSQDRSFDPENAYSPLVDIYETEDGTTVLTAEMPGADSDSLDVQVDKGTLTITAKARPLAPDEGYSLTYGGFGTGRYFRAFALSDEIDREKIEARFENGVLRLHLPKAEAAKTRKVPIQLG
jgi:HSP20 family molecular chaperone IbpA